MRSSARHAGRNRSTLSCRARVAVALAQRGQQKVRSGNSPRDRKAPHRRRFGKDPGRRRHAPVLRFSASEKLGAAESHTQTAGAIATPPRAKVWSGGWPGL